MTSIRLSNPKQFNADVAKLVFKSGVSVKVPIVSYPAVAGYIVIKRDEFGGLAIHVYDIVQGGAEFEEVLVIIYRDPNEVELPTLTSNGAFIINGRPAELMDLGCTRGYIINDHSNLRLMFGIKPHECSLPLVKCAAVIGFQSGEYEILDIRTVRGRDYVLEVFFRDEKYGDFECFIATWPDGHSTFVYS